MATMSGRPAPVAACRWRRHAPRGADDLPGFSGPIILEERPPISWMNIFAARTRSGSDMQAATRQDLVVIRRHCSMTTLASVLLRNHSRLRHSSLNLPLKLSYRRIARDTNSGPLSDRTCLGAPWTPIRCERAPRSPCRTGSSRLRRSQAHFRELVDHGQALQLLSIGTDIVNEVISPDLVGSHRPLRPRSMPSDSLARPFARYLQLRLAP